MRVGLIILVGLVIISAAAISAFFLIPELREIILPKPMSIEEEYKALSQKALDAPPYKADYVMSLSMQNILGSSEYGSGMGLTYSFDITQTHLSRSQDKISVLVSLLGFENEAEVYLINGKSITCKRTSYASIYGTSGLTKESTWECQIGKEDYYSTFDPSKMTQSTDLTKKTDYNISFINEKKIAERNTRCYAISYSGKDINVPLLSSSAYLAAANSSNSLTQEQPKFPTGFSLLSDVNYEKESIYEETKFDAEVCLDKEHGILALMDSNFSIKMKGLKKPMEMSLKFELKKIEFGKVSEQDLKPPVAFVIDANCSKKEISIKLTALEDLRGRAKLTLLRHSSWLYYDEYSSGGSDSNVELENELEKDLGEISLKAFESKDFKIVPDKNLSYGSKEVQLCVGDKCQKSMSYGCYISSYLESFTIYSASCSDENVSFVVYPYSAMQGTLKAKLKDDFSGETLVEKDLGYVSLESYKKKSFEFNPNTTLSGSEYLEVCIDDECTTYYYCSTTYSYNEFYSDNLNCDKNNISFRLNNKYATKDYSGDLTIKGYSDYSRKKIIFDKNIGFYEIKAGETKKVSADVESNLSDYSTIYLDICIGKNCDKTSCYPSFDYYIPTPFPPTPFPTFTPVDVNLEAKAQNCLTGTTDLTVKEYCLSNLMSYYVYYPDPKTVKNSLPLCEAIKKFVEENMSRYTTMENYGFLYNVPQCYATYGFYSGEGASICEKLPDKDINIIQKGSINIIVTVNFRKECKSYYAKLLAIK